jgi:hypothetical protein
VQDIEPLKQLMFHYMAIAVKLSAASDGKNSTNFTLFALGFVLI